MADTTLNAIQIKVRRLTRSPSTAQLSNADLNQYINTFVLYDFPESIRTFNLKTTFKFFTNPYQDRYPTDIASFGTNLAAKTNPLYDFQNKYLSIDKPIFIGGYDSFYTQSREEMFGIYPILNSIVQVPNAVGNGLNPSFSGVINANQSFTMGINQQQVGLLQRNVLISSIANDGTGLTLVDLPIINITGYNTLIGNLYDPNSAAYQAALANPPITQLANNYVNYATGQFSATFTSAPGYGELVYSQTVPQVLSLPQAMLYYDNTFILRPIPDQAYPVSVEAFIRPTELLSTNQSPNLNEWWQYISYGAAKKIFEDRMDLESVQLILPEFKKQEALCLRRSLVQLATQRTATIYTEQTGLTHGWAWGQNNGSI